MSLWRRNAKRDANEPAIVAAAEAMGATWQPLSIHGGPDGIVGVVGRMALAEIKVGNAKLRDSQKQWHAWWRGPSVHVVRTVDDMIALVQGLRRTP